jgi:release factor glutamine methyltransferase
MTVKEALQKAEESLQKMYFADGALTGIPQKKRRQFNARLDAEVLLAYALSTSREEILIHENQKIELDDYKKYQNYVERRLKHEPVALITGKKEFYGLIFKVQKGILIPRPETELLVEKALEEAKELNKKFGTDFVIADIGTGCGNIIISIAKNLQKYFSSPQNSQNSSNSPTFNFPKLYAVDVADDVLALAQQNAQAHQVADLIEFKNGNLIAPIPHHIDLLVANLPYLPKSDYLNASLDVRLYEPESALVGGDDGLDYIRELLDQVKNHYSPTHLTKDHPQMIILLEIDPSQPDALRSALFERLPKASLEIFSDLSIRPRIAKIKL